jgi:hypothetical protein
MVDYDEESEASDTKHTDAVTAAEDPEAVLDEVVRHQLIADKPAPIELKDRWEKREFWTVRVHDEPRTNLFSPLEVPDDPPPVDIKHIDVMRSTRTNLYEFPSLKRIDDCWTGHEGDKKILHLGSGGTPTKWTGETWFETVAPKHPDWRQIFIGPQIVQQTLRTQCPDLILPHEWNMASPEIKKTYIRDSKKENKNRDDARTAREYPWERIAFEDAEAYHFNLKHMAFNNKTRLNVPKPERHVVEEEPR